MKWKGSYKYWTMVCSLPKNGQQTAKKMLKKTENGKIAKKIMV